MSTETVEAMVWRLAQAKDLADLFEIEKLSFSDPWTWGELEEELTQPFSRLWVVEHEGKIAAFGIQWFIAGESQLADIAVRPCSRRRGLGREMMERLLTDAFDSGMSKMTLEVRDGNKAAIELYRHMGFVETSRRARFYEDKDDAILMEKSFEKQ